MGIVEEDIARVRAATDFVALAGEHLALRKVGRSYVGLCPFHPDKSPSLSLSPELGLYYCFGCQASGDVITFIREVEHLDFAEAVERLASRSGITLRYDDAGGGQDHQRRTRVYETLERAIEWYHAQLLEAPEAKPARQYLARERGYDRETVVRYRLGWAPDGWSRLGQALRLPPAALADAGLVSVNDQGRRSDVFRARILFPIFEASGRPVGAGGRQMPGGRPPKYKNTTNTVVYDKSRILYGLNWAKTAVVERQQVVMCEGYTDVIGLQRAGIDEAVATCGTALADGHVKLVTSFARRIILAYDVDAAGQAAAERYHALEQRFEVDIRVAALPPGSDPADLARSDPAALHRAVREARPYLEFRLARLWARSDLDSAEGRARAASAAVGMVAAHPDDLVRDQYLMAIADRSRIPVERLRTLPPPSAEPDPPGRSRTGGRRPAPDGGEARLPPLPGSEIEALRLAVHRPEEVAARLEPVLFDHPLTAATLDLLLTADTLAEAVEAAEPQVATLLGRLAVEEPTTDADDVLVRLVERAGHRALTELSAEARRSADGAAYVPTLGWLKLALETLRPGETASPGDAREAEERLLAWLVANVQSPADRGGRRAEDGPAELPGPSTGAAEAGELRGA